MGYTIRRISVEDISQVSEIDREAFPTEWPPPSFKRELNNPLIRYLVVLDDSVTPSGSTEVTEHKTNGTWGRLLSRVRHLLATGHSPNNAIIPPDRRNIIGYAAIWLMVDEAHLTSIAVRKTHRRQGIGELLLISIIKLAVQMKAEVVTLETRVSNSEAQALYDKYGFNRVGLRRRYYTDNSEDAVIMTTDKITSPSYQTRFRKLERNYIERYGAAAMLNTPPLGQQTAWP